MLSGEFKTRCELIMRASFPFGLSVFKTGFQLHLIGQSGGISTLTGLWLAHQEGIPLWLVEVDFQLGLSFIWLASQEASKVWVTTDK